MRSLLLVSFLALLLACSSDPTKPPVDPADVRVSPSHVFAGGEVFLSGDWYRTTDSLPRITAGASFLAVRRVNDSTVAATLPSTTNGMVRLGELSPRALYDRGPVNVYGYQRLAHVSVPTFFSLTPHWTPNFFPIVIADSLGVAVLDPRTDQVVQYDSIGSLFTNARANCPRAGGPSSHPGEFLLYRPGNSVDRWAVVPDTVRKDSTLLAGCFAAQLADSVYASTDLSYLFITGPTVNLFTVAIDTRRFYRSPDGKRLALAVYAPGGAPVFDLQNFTTAYIVPSVGQVTDAVFTSDGSRLYLASLDDRVVVVDAANGDSLAGAVVADSAITDAIALDEAARLVFVVKDRAGATSSILVLDQQSLAQVGEIEIPALNCGRCFLYSVLQVDRANSEVLLTSISYPSGVDIRHFRLPPLPQ